MYHFFVDPAQIEDGRIDIFGPDVNHIKNVLRMRAGEKILISNGADKDYLCEIETIGQGLVSSRILSCDSADRELPAKLFLFQGLPKGDKMEFIIQKAVELGVFEIIPVATKRSVVKLDEKKRKSRRERWDKVAQSAAKQSGRTVIPGVEDVMSLAEAFEYASSFDVNLIPYEGADNMEETRRETDRVKPGVKAGIFIGPEGGFDEEEIALALKHGVKPITLGKRILRTETAGLTVLSVLMFQLES